MNRPVKIALDSMGGDFAPAVLVKGAVLAQKEANGSFRIVLVGDADQIQEELRKLGAESLPFIIQPASETIRMDDPAILSLKKKDSSIAVAMQMQKDGAVDAVVSAGHTGAVMTSALITLGRIEGISRPAIATYLPTQKEQDGVLVLDVGANSECKARHLLEFGIMGSIYSESVLNKTNPRVGLLSIGEESNKGNDLILSSHKLFLESSLNFVGNVEGNKILKGSCDVVVCDGFVGNVMLKFAESIDGFLTSIVKKQIKQNLFSKLGILFLQASLRRLRKVLDYSEYGGAPLLGVNGVCIVAHGGSSPKAIKNAIKVAYQMSKKNVNIKIREVLSSYWHRFRK
ncbi:MAG: hypothetical protein A2145_06705 [candidate division Zixibacteria bacterium RBG_16_40_9]|nr:MAG: hypothetical protein A2145_06705 [candidate division Zixibacteria bacterium RBG_16_40_9]